MGLYTRCGKLGHGVGKVRIAYQYSRVGLGRLLAKCQILIHRALTAATFIVSRKQKEVRARVRVRVRVRVRGPHRQTLKATDAAPGQEG